MFAHEPDGRVTTLGHAGGCGEIGKRDTFRAYWGKPLGGSSPLSRISTSHGALGASRRRYARAMRRWRRSALVVLSVLLLAWSIALLPELVRGLSTSCAAAA